MKTVEFKKGLHLIKKGIYAYLQPDGSYGLSNAGLVTSGGKTLLVDTLYDLKHTGEMLDLTDRISVKIDRLVNTHAHGDHYFGNQLVRGAEIIMTKKNADEIFRITPAAMSMLVNLSKIMFGFGKYLQKSVGRFSFRDISIIRPDITFENELNFAVGHRKVKLIEVKNAHSKSDVLVLLPDDRVLFAGDIAFIDVTPVIWEGPVSNWIKACDMILKMNVDLIVPGHGPVSDKRGIRLLRKYFEYTHDEAKKRYNKGMTFYEAAVDIDLKEFAEWRVPERIVSNVFVYYQEFTKGNSRLHPLKMFYLMSRYLKDKNIRWMKKADVL